MREHRVTVHMHVCLVALGSALGGVARYLVSQGLGTSAGFPWCTLGVNVAGSLAIGLISGALAHATGNVAAVRAFAVVGFSVAALRHSRPSRTRCSICSKARSMATPCCMRPCPSSPASRPSERAFCSRDEDSKVEEISTIRSDLIWETEMFRSEVALTASAIKYYGLCGSQYLIAGAIGIQ